MAEVAQSVAEPDHVLAPAGAREVRDAESIVRQRFANFLRSFEVRLASRSSGAAGDSTTEAGQLVREYCVQIDHLAEMDQTTLFVDFEHLLAFDRHLAATVQEEYYRFEPALRLGLLDVIRELHPDFATLEGAQRDFYVGIYNMLEQLRVRELRCAHVGQLVSFAGTVTRTSEVRPELLSGTFRCEDCSTLVAGVEQQFKYTTPTTCTACKNTSKWHLVLEQSRFADWQRVRVQENADEIPPGSMPRSMDVILRHGAVERAKAGDKAVFTGMLVVVPDVAQLMRPGSFAKSFKRPGSQQAAAAAGGEEGVTGTKELGVRDLTYRLAFIAQSVQTEAGATGPASDEGLAAGAGGVGSGGGGGGGGDEFSAEEKALFREVVQRHEHQFYTRLAQSVAPTVYGHEEVKRGVLLMLLGGVHKRTSEGIRLRGDINVCIVGDPATAKSQFLKYTAKFLPRAIYTSGKASSAAGLTASVVRDRDTGEYTIEAGALMLADNGVCCIDEFDKMDPADQVAIHEAMEQQTISITKAGIQATLNARASILAAANPVMGRYDRSRTLRQNVAISPPIMSRFDLFFVLLDDCDDRQDELIAEHIVRVHRAQEQPSQALRAEFDLHFLRRFVRYARTLNPIMDARAAAAIESCFRRLRQSDAAGAAATSYRVTIRQLESMIRLSEALARLHLDTHVREHYVLEAYRLLRRSILHVDTGAVHIGLGGALASPKRRGDDASDAAGHSAASPSRSPGTPRSSQSTPPQQRRRHDDAKAGAPEEDEKLQQQQQQQQRDGDGDGEISVTVEELNAMRLMLLSHLEDSVTPENGGAMTQRALIQWYLDALAAQGRDWTPDSLAIEARRIRLVIDYFIATDRCIMLVQDVVPRDTRNADGSVDHVAVGVLAGDDAPSLAAQTDEEKDNRLLALHPNAALPADIDFE